MELINKFQKLKRITLSTTIKITLFLATFHGCANNHEKEVYLIPNGYIGKIVIIFHQNDGNEKKYDSDGNRVYEISKSGILKTKFSDNPGGFSYSDRKFYYVDSMQNKRELEWFTQINPKFRDIKEAINQYGDSVSVLHLGTSSKGRVGPNYIEGMIQKEYVVDSVKNIFKEYIDN